MKLLIVTQKVDRTDPILGFFHRWIECFAEECDSVVALGQYVGSHGLPDNVHIHSLQKENGLGRVRQILRFWKLIFSLRSHYDSVLVHMTPIWAVLGFPLWLVLRKPVYLWYEARGGGWALPVSLRLVRKTFGATQYGLPASSPKHRVLGHGIDARKFSPAPEMRDENTVLSIGRITPVKHYDLIYRSFASLPESYRLVIAGGTVTESDALEEQKLADLAASLGIASRITTGFRTHDEIPNLLRSAAVLVHACSGGLDKVLLEAMSCGCIVLTTSRAAAEVLPPECVCTEGEYADRLHTLLSLSDEDRQRLSTALRTIVIERHELHHLIVNMVCEMS